MAKAKEEKVSIEEALCIPPLPSTLRGRGFHMDATMKKTPRLLYCSNNLVVQRNIDEPNTNRLNPQHACDAKIAKFHPNGEWVCSGDDGGQVYVWAHKSFVVKNEIMVGKSVTDIAWSFDGQRIAAVGAGKDDKGKVFPWNTNNKLGELTGSSKSLLCCDFKPNRPFRVITGGEDFAVYYYKGPPFKFEAYKKEHKNYVNGLKFTPKGDFYVSVSSDKQICVFDSKTGSLVRKIVDKKNGHKGSIYEISFNKEGTQFMTSSADKTCKIWNFLDGNVLHTFRFADKPVVTDMQVSCIWMEKYMVSVSLSGRINYLDPECKQERPVKIITGHKKSVVDLAFNKEKNIVYSVDVESQCVATECKAFDPFDMIGDPHSKAQYKFVGVTSDCGALVTIGTNDTLAISAFNADNTLIDKKSVLKCDGAARALCCCNANPNKIIVPIHRNALEIYENGARTTTVKLEFTPVTAVLSRDDSLLAVSGEDNKVYIFETTNYKITKEIVLKGQAIAMDFSADGKLLVCGTSRRHIWVYDLNDCAKALNAAKPYQYHISKLTSVSFSPDGKYLVSTAQDGNIYLWMDVDKGIYNYIHLDRSFYGGITAFTWIANRKFAASGADCTIRYFDIND